MRALGTLLCALMVFAGACTSRGPVCRPQRIAVLTAMPSELAPLVARARIDETLIVDGHTFRVGELGGMPVVLGLTWIGMENARVTAHSVLQRFRVTGVVVSGVAGSQLRIADVAVPEAWAEPDGTTHAAHAPWLALAREIARPGAVALEKCTPAPPSAPQDPLCLGFEPAIVVGKVGHSGDSFGGKRFGCDPKGGGVWGCDIEPEAALSGTGDLPAVPEGSGAPLDEPLPYVKDMETAAIAREAKARGIPFVAFRAASDGSEDPLGLTQPFAQFFVYYDLASRNAAAAAVAFLEKLTATSGTCVPAA